MKVAILGNFTLDLIAKQLEKAAKQSGIELDLYIAGFGQYAQDILRENSILYRFNPEIILLSLDLETFAGDIFYKVMDLPIREIKPLIMERFNELTQYLDIMASRITQSLILVDNYWLAPRTTLGTLEYNSPYSEKEIMSIFNLQLSDFAKKHRNIKIVDVHSLILLYGFQQLYDLRLYYTAKMHWSAFGLEKLANLYLRYIKAYLGLRKKCILLDLDNTLWGGIIGDDGVENIILSNDGEGKAYYDFQHELLQLYKRGILLAICSKNSEDIAMNAIKNHPYMHLRPEQFAAIRINWENKAKNIVEIAKELNISPDSMVFLDDSPFERMLIKSQLPDVEVPEMPEDSSDYPEFLRSLEYFDFLYLTDDDLKRNQMYSKDIERKKLQDTSIDIESFYYSLDMIAYIEETDDYSQPRVAQLTQKTSQFNLTTRRYPETDIKTFRKDKQYRVFQLKLEDKFGDSGIVGVSIIKIKKDTAYIDTFLLSCRVLGRTVETSFFFFIIEKMRKLGVRRIIGEYMHTKKNMPCRYFYRDHGFNKISESKWSLNLKNHNVYCPPWITIKEH